MTKTCPDCRQLLSTAAYGRDAARADGLQFYCRACTAARNAATYRRKRARLGKTVRERPVVPPGHKFCPSCGEVRPHAQWHRQSSSSDGFTSYCKPCRKTKGRVDHLRRTFGLTPEELADRVAAQGDRCAICRGRPPRHIDHDHASGNVRGVLCGPCNMGLGQFQDKPELLRAAARYLARHQPRMSGLDVTTSRYELDLCDYLVNHQAG
jgi:hypothetical protein